MTQLAIIPRKQHDIARELSECLECVECLECLENSGIRVYATHRAQGYTVLWAEDPVISIGTQVLRNAGFEAAPLTRTRSLKLVHRPLPIRAATASNTVSN